MTQTNNKGLPIKTWILFEDKEYGYYGSRNGIGEIIGVYTTKQNAEMANIRSGNCYQIKEIDMDMEIYWTNT